MKDEDYSEYEGLKWDYKHNSLPDFKIKKYMELKKKYEKNETQYSKKEVRKNDRAET